MVTVIERDNYDEYPETYQNAVRIKLFSNHKQKWNICSELMKVIRYLNISFSMLQKLKDGANKLKAKIGGDELDQKLAEVVSEQNWQASTQQLHEVANAAYNYEKWQRISEFIWDKLKKSKSWKKILKTFNLIEFLLKNGPPSIISNFKYDIYQLRTFESYSNYVDGVDKGEIIRERAKAVVNLLSNEEHLEEERVKAKAIREKMANVVGGTTYGSSGGYGGNDTYGYGSRPESQKNKTENSSYNYGTTTGHFGDYAYNKSTLDKYKDASKSDKNTTKNASQKEEKKSEVPTDTKKPFERVANKLSKPGQKREEKIEQTKQSPVKTTPNNNNQIIDFFNDSTPTPTTNPPPPPQQQNPFFLPQPQPIQPPQVVQPIQQPQPIVQQPVISQAPPQYFQPQPPQQPYQQTPYQQLQPQPYQPNQLPYQQQPYQPFGQPPQPAYNNQFGGIPNQYPSFNQPNQFGYPQQPQPVVGQPNPYNPQYPPAGIPQNNYNAYGNTNYAGNVPTAPVNLGITLSTNKPAQNSANLAQSGSGTAQNVKWLSNTEKGLIDFSDFGAQIKKKQAVQDSKTQANNMQMDNWW